MEIFSELALETAETAGAGLKIDKEVLSPSVTRLCFVAPSAVFEGKGRGRSNYHTLITKGDPLEDDALMEELSKGVAASLLALLKGRKKRVLAVGLGNPSAVVDALGAEVVKRLSAGEKGKKYLATMVPSVFGVTGMETARVVKGVASEFNPDLILTVDTLATRRAERLFRAVQITDGGVVPGGGVGNRREPICAETFGIPVLSVGVPLLARADKCASLPEGLVVTPKEIDLLVPRFAISLARGVEEALFE